MIKLEKADFSARLLAWFDQHGRKNLPWQQPATPYRVWVSEIMLQQTQVATVIPYFNRFMERFPDLHSLAQAEQSEVLTYWSGLGYYARGRNLHKAARGMVEKHHAELPQTVEELIALAGIGQSTAHAILSLAYHQPKAICDGNVKRVLARWSALEDLVDKPQGQSKLWVLAQELQSHERPANYTQAIMDFGATLCTRSKPQCYLCPLKEDCQALHLQNTQAIAVTSFPRKSSKAAKPERFCDMYLLQHPDGRIWLNAPEKEDGLWGGLYQLPQAVSEVVVAEATNIDQLAVTQHIFTHFKQLIQPYVMRISFQQAQNLEEQTLGDWYHPESNSLPRPAVVDKLLQRVNVENTV